MINSVVLVCYSKKYRNDLQGKKKKIHCNPIKEKIIKLADF